MTTAQVVETSVTVNNNSPTMFTWTIKLNLLLKKMIVQSEKVFNKFCKYKMYIMLYADPIPRIGQTGLLSKEMQMLSELICLHKYYFCLLWFLPLLSNFFL